MKLRGNGGRVLAAVLLVGGAGFAGCSGSGGGGGGGGAAAQTPGQELCAAIASHVQRCGPATPCDDQLVADCAKIVDLMNDDFLRAAGDCMKGGGSPAGCLAQSFGGLTPSSAHQSFATTFCGDCTGGLVPGCEELFFAQGDTVPDELKLAGAAILPLSDDLVAEIETECASANPLTCAAQFSSCAQGVIAKRAVPTDTVGCLFDALLQGDTGGGSSCPGDGGAGAGGQGGSGGSGGSGATGGVGGSTGGVGGGTGGVGGGTGGSGGGTGGSGGGTCTSPLVGASCTTVGFGEPTCDGCVHSLCCTTMETCFDDDACGGLLECVATNCASATDLQVCVSQFCGHCSAGAPLYDSIIDCIGTSCSAECS